MPSRPAPARRAFDLSRCSSLGEVLEDALLRHRSGPCLVESDRGRVVRELSYADLRAEVRAIAGGLAGLGLAPGERVAIAMHNGPRWIAGAAAALRQGLVLAPLDARQDGPGLARLLAHCGARLALVDGPVWRRLAGQDLGAVGRVLVSEPLAPLEAPAAPWEELLAPGATPLPVPRERDDPAAIVYSSGTTGRLKGCVLTHGNYLSQLEALANLFPMEEEDVYLSILPASHAIDFMCGFLVPLLCGARVVHLRTLRPEWLVAACRDHGVSHLSVVPAILTALARRLRERLDGLDPLPRAGLRALLGLNRRLTRDRPREALSRALLLPVHEALGGRLRRIFAGGAFVPREPARYLYELGLPVVIGYGLSEACAVVTVNDLDPFRADTVGRPVPGAEVRLDGRDAAGVGEVLVRGPQVFRGYLDDPELTAGALDGDGWLRTGDLGAIDAAGHLVLVGRKKDVVVTAGGKNVYPEEVERRFEGLEVEELAVLPAHLVWGGRPGEDEALVLVVRPRSGATRDVPWEELARRNRALPAYQRLAGALVATGSFPRTTSLKLRRDELARILAREARREDVRPLG